MRARPPGVAGTDARRRAVFAAALQQSEELFLASAAVGPASKPLPLFYALSQAGRAIAAAHNPKNSWQIRTHGLTVVGQGDGIATTLLRPKARKDRSDAFSSVADALGSECLKGPVTLAALWAALPELATFPHLAKGALPALEITPEGTHPTFLPALQPALGSIIVPDVGDLEELETYLSLYARTAGWEHVAGPLRVGRVAHFTLRWLAGGSSEEEARPAALRPLRDIAIPFDRRWFLQPRLGEPPTAPNPLLVWWALLIALSSVARYHPAEWTAALNVDAAETAVELEEGIAIAQRRLPEMLAEALERGAPLGHRVAQAL